MKKEVVRDFKRHYHKVRKVYSELANAGGFKFEIKFERKFGGDTFQATNETPNEAETVRFVALMGRFLYPNDRLYYKTVWTSLQLEFGLEISNERVGEVNALIKQLDMGSGETTYNNDNLTPEKIYQTISDGGFFDDDEKAIKYLEEMTQVPVMGPLLRHQFYDYSLRAFRIVSSLFDIILQIENRIEGSTIQAKTIVENLCIYCLTTEGSFTSEEHVIAESLGNDDAVLPKGFVCDACNNEVLSGLDNALINFEPVAFFRVQHVPYTKEGKFPKANFSTFTLEKTGPRHLKMTPKNKAGEIKNLKQIGDDLHSFNVEWKGKKINWKLIGRALYKIALGMVAFKQGRDQACNSKFDAARSFIREGQGVNNNLIMQTRIKPHASIHTRFYDLPEGTPVFIDLFGIIFFLNLENAPVVQVDEETAKLGFQQFSLGG
ncbi:MAG TPA: HNH endonuclease [Pyrinomonadaceae bacterium]|nr:HNH endonuclease [Pyrinomonadaceae bacterium]